jgi:hypothetical protein
MPVVRSPRSVFSALNADSIVVEGNAMTMKSTSPSTQHRSRWKYTALLSCSALVAGCSQASHEAQPFYTPPEPTLQSQYLGSVKSVVVIHSDDEPCDCAVVLSQSDRDNYLAWRASSEEDAIWGGPTPDTTTHQAAQPNAPASPTPNRPTNLPPHPGD